MLYSKVFLAVLALSVHAVSAGLYPTQPIAKTVFRGAQMNNVTWVDSESKPTMYALGKIRMELYVDNTVSGTIVDFTQFTQTEDALNILNTSS